MPLYSAFMYGFPFCYSMLIPETLSYTPGAFYQKSRITFMVLLPFQQFIVYLSSHNSRIHPYCIIDISHIQDYCICKSTLLLGLRRTLGCFYFNLSFNIGISRSSCSPTILQCRPSPFRGGIASHDVLKNYHSNKCKFMQKKPLSIGHFKKMPYLCTAFRTIAGRMQSSLLCCTGTTNNLMIKNKWQI